MNHPDSPIAAPDYYGSRERVDRFQEKTPGVRFYAACTLTALALIWASTDPGYVGAQYEGAFYIAVMLGVYWLLRLALHVRAGGKHGRRFLVAPVCALVLGGLLWTEAPFQVRWEHSEAAFAEVVAALPPGEPAEEWNEDEESLDVPGRLGTYRVSRAERVPGGVLFEVPGTCGWSSMSGFGWFPTKPDPLAVETSGFSKPVFWHLDGPWYGWCARS